MGGCSAKPPRDAAPQDSGAGVPSGHAADEPSTRELSAVHKGALFGVCCATGSVVATCGEDGVVALRDWQRADESVVAVWRGHTRPVNRVVAGKSGKVYSCSRDQTLCAWSTDSDAPLRRFEGHELTVSAVTVDDGEQTLCSGSRDYSVRLWDIETGATVHSSKISRNLVTSLKWVPTEPAVVQGSEDLRLRVWDTRDGLKAAQTMGGYTYFPLCIDIAPGGNEIVTGCKGFNGSGCEAKVWDRRMEKILFELRGHQQDTTGAVYLPRSGGGESGSASRMIATASKDQTVKLWDASTGELVSEHSDAEAGMYTGLSAPPCASGLEDAAAVDVLDAQAPVAFCATTFSGSLILYDEQGARLAHAPSLGELE